MRKLYYPKTLVIILCCVTWVASALAQNSPAALSLYNSAVDKVNCQTIKFVHNEAGRSDIANSLDCSSYESIAASIPDDEQQTTLALAKNIDNFKNKYSDKKPLDEQLNALIAFAEKQITRKKRKGDVEAYKAQLNQIKTETLSELNGASGPASAHTVVTSKPQDTNTTVATDDTVDDTSVEQSSEPNKWQVISMALSTIAIILSLVSLFRKNKPSGGGPNFTNDNEEKLWRRNAKEEEWERRFNDLESKINNREQNMKSEYRDNLATATASTSYTEPEITDESSELDNDPYLNTPGTDVETEAPHDEPIEEPETQYHPGQEIHPMEPEEIGEAELSYSPLDITDETEDEPQSITPEITDEDETEITDITPEEPQDEIKEYPHESTIENPIEVKEEEVHESFIPPVNEARQADSEVFQPQEEPEIITSGPGLPEYYYASAPNPDGSFSEAKLTQEPGANSIYEIEVYNEMPDKAFFALLPYPKSVEMMLDNAQSILAPCCEFMNSPEGSQSVQLMEEGQLTKEDSTWKVVKKARIRFE